MVTRLDDNSKCTRNWTGNDRVSRHYFGRVRLNESPLRIKLYWKADDKAPRKLIGAYQIDLKSLLEEGYIRRVTGSQKEVILRFQRANSGEIQIAINREGRALKIGAFRNLNI